MRRRRGDWGPADDRRLIAAVREVRAELGSCTYRTLAARLGMSTYTLQRRVAPLIGSGRLVASSEAGSLRPAPRRRG